MSASAFPLYTGEIIDSGRLRLLSVLGQGGFGVVYRAQDTRTNCTHAVKWLGLPFAYNTRSEEDCNSYLSMLREEIWPLERVSSHPNVITMHRAVFDYERECYWLVLDFVSGGDVFDAVQLRNPFWRNEDRTRRVVLQLIDAVAYLHANDLYHRDIKPENVLLSADAQTIYLTDFGAATSAQSSKQNVGTAEYMTPEQTLGRSYSSARADAWALAVTLFYLLTGELGWDMASSASPGYVLNMCRLRSLNLDRAYPLSTEVQELLRDALQPEPEMRLDIAGMRARAAAIKRFYPDASEVQPYARGIATRMEMSAANWVEHRAPPTQPPRPSTLIESATTPSELPCSVMHTFAPSMNLAALLSPIEEDQSVDIVLASPTLSADSLFCPSLASSTTTASSSSCSLPDSLTTDSNMDMGATHDVINTVEALLFLSTCHDSDGDASIPRFDLTPTQKTPRLGDFIYMSPLF